MKKLVFLVMGLSAFSVGAQTVSQAPIKKETNRENVMRCSHDEHMEQMRIQDPARYATINSGPAEPHKAKYKPVTTKATGTVYTIPVVFHILHNNGAENISEAQILDGLSILNRDWRRQNPDADNVVSAFQGMPADVEIEFKLATVAPNGACFNGITRTVNNITNDGSDGQLQVNAIVAGNDVYQGVWPHNQYLNIYVCADIGGAAGYTYLPQGSATASATNMYYNGIFVLHDYVGSIGTSSVTTSRTLTHESGHWFNLKHVWGSTNTPAVSSNCNDDDGVQDTPNCIGSTSCLLSQNTCNSDDAYWGTAMIDNTENYMDYSYCSKMFTPGQVTRMRAAAVSSTAGRNNVWTTSNLQAVGAMPGTTLCALDFDADNVGICTGSSITYTTNSGSLIATYSWSFTGGTPSSSTVASPTVTYNTAGTYPVTLTVTATSNGQTYSKSKTSYITVSNSTTATSLPLTEGFTSSTFPPTGWSLVSASGVSWTRTTSAGLSPTAGNAMMFNNHDNDETENDLIKITPVDLSTYSNAQMTFDVAYRPYSSSYSDGMEVLVSSNCGSTYSTLYSKTGTVLATVSGYQTSTFTPTAAQWRKDTVDLSAFVGQPNVVIAFRNLASYGNNIYVDNINITGTVNSAPPTASFTAVSSTICEGQSVTFNNTTTGGTTYSWSFPGGTPSTSTAQNPTVTYATAGTYNVSLTATNANGSNTSTQNNYITVSGIPATPSISAGGATSFCAGGSVVLTAPSSSAYSWSNGSSTQSITVTTAGTYTVQVSNAAGCQSTASNGVAVTVNPLPSITFPNLGTVCTYNPSFTLNTASPSGGSYSGTGVTGSTFDPAAAGAGTYTITYAYTDGNGCSNTKNSQIVVDQCLGLTDGGDTYILVFPNPSSGVIQIQSSEQVVEVTVYDEVGRYIVKQAGMENGSTQLDLSAFASGMYHLHIQTESGLRIQPIILKK